MSDSSPHQYLYENLTVLNELKPGGSDFVKCIKDDMFTKPNRTAFDQVLFYLCNVYDSARYMPKVPWPILDRSQERTFRQNTVTFVKEIIKEVPEARIPPFSPSFLSTPGGERLAKFMWKFSLLVLKTVIEREGDVDGLLHYPTAPAMGPIMESITESVLKEIGKESNELCQLVIDSSKYAKKLSNEISNQQMEINRLKNELSETIQSVVNCPLSDKDKSLLLTCDRKQFLSIIAEWQNHLNKEADAGKSMLKILQDRSIVVTRCYDSVQALVNSKTMPVVLDASNFPTNLKDSNGNVNLAYVISEAAITASSLFKSLSMFGGFQCYDLVLPELESIRNMLQEVEQSFSETKTGFIELLSASLENMRSPINLNVAAESPLLKGGLQMGYEMLQEAQTNTPPMVFDIRCDMSSRISTERSPFDGAVRRMRPFSRLKENVGAGSTPKAALSNSTTGLSFRNISTKVSVAKSFSQKDSKYLIGSPKLMSHELTSTVAETPAPANFCPKKFSTSTAHKLNTFGEAGYKTKHSFVGFKSSTQASEKKSSLKTLIELSSPKSYVRPGVSRTSHNKTGSEVGPSSSLVHDFQEDNGNLTKRREETVEIAAPAISKDVSLKKSVPQQNLHCALSSPLKQATKQDVCFTSPVLKKQESLKIMCNLNSTTSQDNISSSPLSPPLIKTPSRSQPTNVKINDANAIHGVPKIQVFSESCTETFDSPQSTSFGAFSPPSADNSFFSTDMAIGGPPKFDLDSFGDDISPSGRVSLCPSDVKVNEIVTETVDTAIESTRRKSLQAIIHRYRELVASSKQPGVQVVLPSNDDYNAAEEESLGDLETSLCDINLL